MGNTPLLRFFFAGEPSFEAKEEFPRAPSKKAAGEGAV
jgi:hypothetical protein